MSRTLISLLISFAFRAFAVLSRKRKIILPPLLFFSRLLDSWISSPNSGGRLLAFARDHAVKGDRILANVTLSLISLVLIASTQIHVAASKKPSAIRSARLLNLLFRNQVLARSGIIARFYFGTLAMSSANRQITHEVSEPENIEGFALNYAIGVAHLFQLNAELARHFLQRAVEFNDSNAERKLGCAYLMSDDYVSAARHFQNSVSLQPTSIMVHQNYAGRYNRERYAPSEWELRHAGRLLIYDNLIQLGEAFYHLGKFESTFYFYKLALAHQKELAANWNIPSDLVREVERLCPRFDKSLPIRILGYEWVTLIGHIGFLDCYLRMAGLGMIPKANYILLAPDTKVINAAFLDLWRNYFCMIEDASLVDRLLPYQRLVGDQFIGVWSDGKFAEPWAHAASRAQVAWASNGLSPLVEVPQHVLHEGAATLEKMGVPKTGWFVAMHVREGGFHGDGPGSNRHHRSADIVSYRAAIEHIRNRGGWIIRLGDKSMSPISGIPGVIDYAHSNFKSPAMDLYLISACRLFVGTTSGLTSAVQAIGTPMLLVNCTSHDAQFWHAGTDFILKPVFDRKRSRYLTIRETYQQPLQSMLIDDSSLRELGYEIHPNTSEDILAAVRYKLDCLIGIEHRADETDPLVKSYRSAISHNPFNFGAALPARPFIKEHPELFVSADCVTINGPQALQFATLETVPPGYV